MNNELLYAARYTAHVEAVALVKESGLITSRIVRTWRRDGYPRSAKKCRRGVEVLRQRIDTMADEAVGENDTCGLNASKPPQTI